MAAPPRSAALPFAAEVGDWARQPWARYVLRVAMDWVENHCVIPDGFAAGQWYTLADWQVWFYANHYRVRPDAQLTEIPGGRLVPTGAPAFVNRRSQIIMPQKAGKGPATASQICLEGMGPAMFAGWARGGETYRCIDHGCGCGYVYEYERGEPMGEPWPTPLIQVTAFSEEQTGNIYDALKPMIEKGPLAELAKVGEAFTRILTGDGMGRVDTVTSSQQSRLGQRVTFVPQDETGIWTKQNKMDKVADTQRRGAAGMGGRTVETTNAWDPAEQSVAQRTAQVSLTAADIFRLHPQGPPGLRYGDKRQRREIHKWVYTGSWWVNLDSIEGEAFDLLVDDPAQAERFYGNRIVAGLGAWMDMDVWAATEKTVVVGEGTEVCGGFDGSESDDWTAIRLETRDGHRFTPLYGPDRRPTYWNPAEWGGSIPRGEVHAAVDEISRRYRLRSLYCDPRDWESEIGDWALKLGEEVVVEWATYRIIDMHKALVQSRNDLVNHRTTHDADLVAADHMSNARKVAKPGDRYILGKPDKHRKIDIAMADTLAHRAASDLRAEGWVAKPKGKQIEYAVGNVSSY